MIRNNPKLDLVNNYLYIKFGEILSICSHDIEWKRNSDICQGPYKCTKNNSPNLDPVHINAYTKFSEILSICFKVIEQKQKSDGQTFKAAASQSFTGTP